MWQTIKILHLLLLSLLGLQVILDIKVELETIETQQYIQTLTLKQLVGCKYVAED
jgi:hypothetical protein